MTGAVDSGINLSDLRKKEGNIDQTHLAEWEVQLDEVGFDSETVDGVMALLQEQIDNGGMTFEEAAKELEAHFDYSHEGDIASDDVIGEEKFQAYRAENTDTYGAADSNGDGVVTEKDVSIPYDNVTKESKTYSLDRQDPMHTFDINEIFSDEMAEHDDLSHFKQGLINRLDSLGLEEEKLEQIEDFVTDPNTSFEQLEILFEDIAALGNDEDANIFNDENIDVLNDSTFQISEDGSLIIEDA